MTTAITRNPHALGILAALAAASVATGDGVAPHDIDPGLPSWTRYTVLYMLAGGELDGPIDDPDADGDIPFQLTSVGRLASEARFQADAAAVAVTTTPIVVAGRFIERVRLVSAGGEARRDDDVKPPLFYVADRFSLISRPA